MNQPIIASGVATPRIVGRGRPIGSGGNIRLLRRMKKGDSLWELPFDKMNSIRVSARKSGIKVQIRKQPDSDKYAIFVL